MGQKGKLSNTIPRIACILIISQNSVQRIDRTSFLGYSPNANCPSRSILPENDVEPLEDRLPDGDLSISPIERKGRGPDIIDEESREKHPLHCATVEQNTLDKQSFHDKDPASIRVPDD